MIKSLKNRVVLGLVLGLMSLASVSVGFADEAENRAEIKKLLNMLPDGASLVACGLTMTVGATEFVGEVPELIFAVDADGELMAFVGQPLRGILTKGRGIQLGSFAVGSYNFLFSAGGANLGKQPLIQLKLHRRYVLTPWSEISNKDLVETRTVKIPFPQVHDYAKGSYQKTETFEDIGVSVVISCMGWTADDAPVKTTGSTVLN